LWTATLPDMNEASRWRLGLARAISGRYALNPRVAVVEIGGSVARGHADRYSDLELGVCWSEAPGLEERLDVIERLGGVLGTVYPRDGDAGEWAEDYAVHDVKIDVSHHTVESLERRLDDVVVRCDPDLARQELASAIRHAVPLHGEEHLRRWQAGIERYPDGLARAMVRQHLRFKPHWAGEMLAERDDFLVVHGAIAGFEQELLLVLMGLNRLYFPGFKWIHRLVGELSIAPDGLGQRLRQALCLEPRAGVDVLHALIRDTLDLVDAHLPEVSTSEVRARFEHRRVSFDRVPDAVFDRFD
jgi:predicted nucleotidyltransferase